MNRRFALLILALCMALACAGCRLAREEESAQDSRLVGVTLKIADWGEPTGTDEEGNPYWALTDGEGPDEDPDALGQYSLILLEVENEEGRGTEARGVWPGEGHTHITVTDAQEAGDFLSLRDADGDAEIRLWGDVCQVVAYHLPRAFVDGG